MLLQTRKWMLDAEFEVEIADNIPEAVANLGARHFDLVLLCHTLNDQECRSICDEVFSKTPATRVLQLNEGWRDFRSLIGPEEQASAARPQTLIEKITEMAQKAQNARSGSPELSDAQ
ncbi:MAG: hypothetical protein WAM85_18955 [Terracidiphilus sp.]